MTPLNKNIALLSFPGFILAGILVFALSMLTDLVRGQSTASSDNRSLTEIYQAYMKTVGKASYLFTGSAYVAKYPNVKGSPFFDALNFQQATVSYGGVLYYDVPLKYDMVSGELVIKNPDEQSIGLPADKVDSFAMNGHLFERLGVDSIENGDRPETGFYERTYKGSHARFYVQRIRVVHKSLRAEDPSVFDNYDSYMLWKDNRFYKIDGQNGLKRLLNLNNQQIKTDINGKRINWKKDKEHAIHAAIENYDQSIKN